MSCTNVIMWLAVLSYADWFSLWHEAFSFGNLLDLRPFSAILWAVTLSSTGTLILLAGSFLASRQALSSSPITRGSPLFRSPCLFSLCLWISHSFFSFVPAGNHHMVRCFTYLDFIRSLHSLFNMSSVFADSLCLLVHMLILLVCWLKVGCPYSERVTKSPCNRGGGISWQSPGSNLANDVKCRRGKDLYINM